MHSPLYQNHIHTDLSPASLEQLLRALRGAVSAVLTLSQIKLNPKLSHCASFQVDESNVQSYFSIYFAPEFSLLFEISHKSY